MSLPSELENLIKFQTSILEAFEMGMDEELWPPGTTIADNIRRLRKELAEAKAVIAQHDLCHNLHGKVDARAFADGCAAEQRKHYGQAPDADEVTKLRAILELVAGSLMAADTAEDDDLPAKAWSFRLEAKQAVASYASPDGKYGEAVRNLRRELMTMFKWKKDADAGAT